MKKLLLLASALVIGFATTSCSSDDDEPKTEKNGGKKFSDEVITVTNFRAKVAPPRDPNAPPGPPPPMPNEFTLYNLRENKSVDFSKFDTDEWDVGFRTTDIIVNGGKVRKGKGGAIIQDSTFDEIKSAPTDDKFVGDESDTEFAIKRGSGKGWYNYTGSATSTNHHILPIPGKTLIVRAGDGKKYAKIQILSYYKDAPKELEPQPSPDITSFYTFKYSLSE